MIKSKETPPIPDERTQETPNLIKEPFSKIDIKEKTLRSNEKSQTGTAKRLDVCIIATLGSPDRLLMKLLRSPAVGTKSRPLVFR